MEIDSKWSELLNHKFVVEFEEEGEGEKHASEGEVLDLEGVRWSLSSTYDEDSYVSLEDSSSAALLEDSEQVSSSSIVPDAFPIFTNTSVKQVAM